MQKPILSKKAKIRKDLEGYILYYPGTGLILLNTTAYEIVSKCNGNYTFDEIISFISKKYGVQIEVVYKDVKAFFINLEQLNILTYTHDYSLPNANRKVDNSSIQ
ncbi:MAG: PqqD family protein [Candidatus Methanoperedens sp.]|nr:PqqD family protein [Candidatus Methanoperedens sp.]